MKDLSMPFNIEVVIIHEGQKHNPSFLNDYPEIINRFPNSPRVNRNYGSLKARKTGGTIEVWETKILVKDPAGEILWKDDLSV